jgi:hypothetical protein
VTNDDRFGWLGKPAEQSTPDSKQIRVLWRMKWRRVVTAALYTHPAGTELRVYFEPESAGDLLHSLVEGFDIPVLDKRAAALRATLLEKGWVDLPPESVTAQ